jgi:hypothetical protein
MAHQAREANPQVYRPVLRRALADLWGFFQSQVVVAIALVVIPFACLLVWTDAKKAWEDVTPLVVFPLATLGALMLVVFAVKLVRAPIHLARERLERHHRVLQGIKDDLATTKQEIAELTRPLQGGVFRNQTLRLADIARDLGTGGQIVAGRRFEDCVIDGPGVVTFAGTGTIAYTHWDADIERGFIVMPEGHMRIHAGVVVFSGCELIRCDFRNVSIIGPETLKKRIDEESPLQEMPE